MVKRRREKSSEHEGGVDDHHMDDDIDELIRQSISESFPSRQTSHFSKLHLRLMKAGSTKDVKLSGVGCGSGARKGQLYCQKEIHSLNIDMLNVLNNILEGF